MPLNHVTYVCLYLRKHEAQHMQHEFNSRLCRYESEATANAEYKIIYKMVQGFMNNSS